MTGIEANTVWHHDLGQVSHIIEVSTSGPGFTDISERIDNWLSKVGVDEGLLTLFVCHTSASLTIQENADPDVQYDLKVCLDKLAPRDTYYKHNCEGPDDMPAHIKSMLTSTSLVIPVQHERMVLGTWQGIYLIEHRDRPHQRQVALHFLGIQKR